MSKAAALSVFVILCLSPVSWAQDEQDAGDEEATHEALRAVRDETLAALNRGDLEGILEHLHPEVVFTAMNAEVCRGRDDVRAYFDRMLTGPNKIVERATFDLQADSLSILHGRDTAIAYGHSSDDYELSNGIEFRIDTRWSATMVLEGGRWWIASFQTSANPFDNPLLSKAKSMSWISGGAAGIVFLVVGLVIGRATKR